MESRQCWEEVNRDNCTGLPRATVGLDGALTERKSAGLINCLSLNNLMNLLYS